MQTDTHTHTHTRIDTSTDNKGRLKLSSRASQWSHKVHITTWNILVQLTLMTTSY